MIHITNEKRTLDNILKAFDDYIRKHDSFDIVYSAKIGYVKLQAPYPRDETPEVVNTPEDLLDALFLEIINDVMFSPDNPRREHNDSAMTRHEKMECRRRIAAILETMEDGDKARCLDFMETYIGEYPESNAQFGRE